MKNTPDTEVRDSAQPKKRRQPEFRHKPCKISDLIGQKFHSVTILGEAPRTTRKHGVRAQMRCDCGKEFVADLCRIRSGHKKTCGCAYGERHGHGQRGDPNYLEYKIFTKMIDRCENPNNPKYKRYGGRGISICPEWRNSFSRFMSDMGPRPEPRKSYSIDRKNNDGDYEPKNCRWATKQQQMSNTSTTWRIRINGDETSFRNACKIAGIVYYIAHKACVSGIRSDPQEIIDRAMMGGSGRGIRRISDLPVNICAPVASRCD